jgi:hypothetical protein
MDSLDNLITRSDREAYCTTVSNIVAVESSDFLPAIKTALSTDTLGNNVNMKIVDITMVG